MNPSNLIHSRIRMAVGTDSQVVDFSQNASRGKKGPKVTVKTTRDARFQLLHLSVLREYIWAELTRDLPEAMVSFSCHGVWKSVDKSEVLRSVEKVYGGEPQTKARRGEARTV